MTNKEAIEAIVYYPPRNYTILREALDKAMETLEHTEWNLCSEGMPPEREWVGTKHFGTTISETVLVTVKYKDGTAGVICGRLQNGRVTDLLVRDYIEELIAWMPLPKPYKGKEI